MARKRGYNWRPDDDAKDVPYHIAGEAKRYAEKGLIRAGLKKPKQGTVPKPSVCINCGTTLPSKNAFGRHKQEVCSRRKRAMRRNEQMALLMEQGIDPLRPELGKAPKGSFLATQLQAAARRYREKKRATVSRSPIRNE